MGSIQKSPVEIELIVHQIVSYLGLEDLLNARLVNRIWNALSLRYCQKLSYCKFKCSSKLKAFSPVFENTARLPIANIRLVSLWNIQSEECSAFFVKHGSHIKKLEVKHSWADNEYTYGPYSKLLEQRYLDNLRIVLENTPNLEHLCLVEIPHYVYRQTLPDTEHLMEIQLIRLKFFTLKAYEGFQPKILKRFLALFPNLKYLDCSETEYEKSVSNEFWSISMKDVRLETLVASTHMPIKFWELFSTQRLEALKLKFNSLESQDGIFLTKFLLSQQNTLKILGVAGIGSEELEDFQPFLLPSMKKLNTLEFSGDYVIVHCPVDSTRVPNLTTITMNLNWIFDCPDFEYKSVMELTLLDSKSKQTHRDHRQLTYNMKKLGKVFPHLRKLTCNKPQLSDGCLAALFSSFPRLTHLDLSLHLDEDLWKDVNLALSGFPKASESFLLELLRLKSPELFRLEPPLGSLGDLKCLTHLTIRFSAWYGMCTITEIGVFMGLMRTPRLHQLTLLGKFSISENDAEKLAGCHRNVLIRPVEEYVPDCGSLTRMYGKSHSCYEEEKERFQIWPSPNSSHQNFLNCKCDQRLQPPPDI